MKKMIVAAAALVFLIVLIAVFAQMWAPVSHNSELEDRNRVEQYVKENISKLSPEKEVLGGKFYVTNISTGNGTGNVEYEDGHILLRGRFTYQLNQEGNVEITSFEILPEEPIPAASDNFLQTGNIVRSQNGDGWDLVYEKPGQPALRVRLELGQREVSWEVGDRVTIGGKLEGDTVVVSQLTKN